MSEKKLNPGCGANIKAGWINMDCVDLPGVVCFHDTNPSHSGFPGVRRAIKEFFQEHKYYKKVLELKNMEVYKKASNFRPFE